MMPRTEYEMTDAELAEILDACKPTRVMMIGGYTPKSPQENANAAWAALGAKMGFDYTTVRPSAGNGERFFTAVPTETQEARDERLARDSAEKKAALIAKLESEIADRQNALSDLKAEAGSDD